MSLTDDELAEMGPAELEAGAARQRWLQQARTRPVSMGKQIPPTDLLWLILLFRCGRGWGKTISEVQWLWWEMWRFPGLIGHAVAPTMADLRTVVFEGPAGFTKTIPTECLKGGSLDRAYNKTNHELVLSNGSKIIGFSATENGDRLRGPQCHALIGDEIAAWNKPLGNLEIALNMALYGLRLPYPDGTPARAVLGTTPKPIPFLKRFEKRSDVKIIHGTSYENLRNLSPAFRNQLLAQAGTSLGRQEIEALYVDDEAPTAILRRPWIRLWPAFDAEGSPRPLPEFSFIIESYDTAMSEDAWNKKTQANDPTACVVIGVFNVAQYFNEADRRKMGIRSRNAALLIDCWAEWLGFPELLDRARAQHKLRYGPKKRKSDIVLIEDKVSGRSLRQSLVRYDVPTWPYNPGQMDKTQRGHVVAPVVKQGMFWVPESNRGDRAGLPRTWVEPFLEEVCSYSGPGSTEHDDQFDATTQALIYLKDRGMLEASYDPETIDREEKLAKDREDAERTSRDERQREWKNPYAA